MGSYFISGPSPSRPTPRISLPIGHRITNDSEPLAKSGLHGFDIGEDALGAWLVHQPEHFLQPALAAESFSVRASPPR
jgi:hypothetical protein